jgi:hypothetical protein
LRSALPRISHTPIAALALLALGGARTARAQSVPAPEAAPVVGIHALAGIHRRQTYAFSEAQLGRIAPGSRPSLGLGFSIESDDGLEVLLPGRIGWRFGARARTEVVPWFGIPLYLMEDSQGRHVPWFGLGGGADLWYRPIQPLALGINVGLLAVGDGDPTLYGGARLWAAAGFRWSPLERVSLGFGAGYARNTSDTLTPSLNADQGAEKVSFGSVLTDGIQPRPVLALELSRALTLGLDVRIDYTLREGRIEPPLTPDDAAPPRRDPQELGGSLGYEAALVVVYTINPR